MGVRRPPHRRQGNNSPQSGTLKIYDLDDLKLGTLKKETDHDLGIPGIEFIQTFEQDLAVIDLGPGNQFASGHAISVTAFPYGGIAVGFTGRYSTIRFAYTWGEGSDSATRVSFFDETLDPPKYEIWVYKNAPAQWIEFNSPDGAVLRAFSVDFWRFGSIDNISVY